MEGEILQELQRRTEAADCFEKAREVAESAYAKQQTAETRRALINAYHTLRENCYLQKDPAAVRDDCLNREIRLVKEALAEAKENDLRLNSLYMDLGDLYSDLRDYSSAIQCYEDCLNTPEEDPDSAESIDTQFYAYEAISSVSRIVGDEARAEECWQ